MNDGFPIVVCCNRVVGPWIQEEPDGCWLGKCLKCLTDFLFYTPGEEDESLSEFESMKDSDGDRAGLEEEANHP